MVAALLAVIGLGFLAGLAVRPPDAAGVLHGLVPRFAGTDSVLLAASMLGATVMPHAIYAHSALARDRHGHLGTGAARARLLRATRWDVGGALAAAGVVNIGLLLLAATGLRHVPGTDSIPGAHAAIVASLGTAVGLAFAIGLLASGLASTSVGAYAGSVVMDGLLHRRVPPLVRRTVTLVPAVALLAAGADPTWTLVLSQVVLSLRHPVRPGAAGAADARPPVDGRGTHRTVAERAARGGRRAGRRPQRRPAGAAPAVARAVGRAGPPAAPSDLPSG